MGRFFLFTVIFAIFLIVLFFPIFITISIYFDVKEKKIAFSLNLFKKIKIRGGYFTRYENGFVLHANKNKAILLPYSKLKSQRKAFSLVNSFEFICLTGVLEGNLEILAPFLFLNSVFDRYKFIDPRFNTCNFSFWLTEKDELKFTTKITYFFTNFILLLALFEFIGRKIK